MIKSGNGFANTQPDLRSAVAANLKWLTSIGSLPLDERQEKLRHELARHQVGPFVDPDDPAALELGNRNKGEAPRCAKCNDYGLTQKFNSARGQLVSACSCHAGELRREALSATRKRFKRKTRPKVQERMVGIGEIR